MRYSSLSVRSTSVAGHGERGERAARERVRRQSLKCGSRRQDRYDSVFVQKINSTVREDGRSREVASHAFAPMHLAGLGIDATGNSIVGDEVQFIAYEER